MSFVEFTVVLLKGELTPYISSSYCPPGPPGCAGLPSSRLTAPIKGMILTGNIRPRTKGLLLWFSWRTCHVCP